MENMIIWRLTEDLDLTIDQSENFSQDLESIGKI